MSRHGLLAISFAAALGSAASVTFAEDVINVCVGKQGYMRLVETAEACRRTEQALAWNVQGPKGEPGLSGKSPVVVDAYGTEVGDVYLGADAEPLNIAFIVQSDEGYITKIGRDGVHSMRHDRVVFDNPECTGQRFILLRISLGQDVSGVVFKNYLETRDEPGGETYYTPHNSATMLSETYQIDYDVPTSSYGECLRMSGGDPVVPIYRNDPSVTGFEDEYEAPLTVETW